MKNKKTIIKIALMIALATLVGLWLVLKKDGSNSFTPNDNNSSDNSILSSHSLTEPTSIWVIVNKKRPLPTDFQPNLVVPNVPLLADPSLEQMKINTKTKPALEKMFTSAKSDGIELVFGSGYRSADLQKKLYSSYVTSDGQAEADKYSARPGYSEHQTGFVADLKSQSDDCYLMECWEKSPEGKWVATNAHKFGFILRYPRDKSSVTGYSYEPWHVRYVGNELARELYEQKKTMEEYFNIENANSY